MRTAALLRENPEVVAGPVGRPGAPIPRRVINNQSPGMTGPATGIRHPNTVATHAAREIAQRPSRAGRRMIDREPAGPQRTCQRRRPAHKQQRAHTQQQRNPPSTRHERPPRTQSAHRAHYADQTRPHLEPPLNRHCVTIRLTARLSTTLGNQLGEAPARCRRSRERQDSSPGIGVGSTRPAIRRWLCSSLRTRHVRRRPRLNRRVTL
jgi:hypothetical protein